MQARPSTSRRTSPRRRSPTAVTLPRRRLSTSGGVDDLERAPRRRGDDDVADPSRVVVDKAEAGAQAGRVELLGPLEPGFLPRGEEELHPRVRAALGEEETCRLEEDGDGGLVVGAQNRPGPVADDAVLDQRFDGTRRREGV